MELDRVVLKDGGGTFAVAPSLTDALRDPFTDMSIIPAPQSTSLSRM